jgi:hypothetical protein
MGTSLHNFRVAVLNHDPEHGSYRWTIETAEDMKLIRRVYTSFGNRDDFTKQEASAMIERQTELARIITPSFIILPSMCMVIAKADVLTFVGCPRDVSDFSCSTYS